MAVSNSIRSKPVLAVVAGLLLMIIIVLLVVRGGHNGQPSAQGGPGNPLATNQGR
jgi:hypothetical protein